MKPFFVYCYGIALVDAIAVSYLYAVSLVPRYIWYNLKSVLQLFLQFFIKINRFIVLKHLNWLQFFYIHKSVIWVIVCII